MASDNISSVPTICTGLSSSAFSSMASDNISSVPTICTGLSSSASSSMASYNISTVPTICTGLSSSASSSGSRFGEHQLQVQAKCSDCVSSTYKILEMFEPQTRCCHLEQLSHCTAS
ncbi:hypothetical protein ElyMa_005411500 [Elysia marginata]|uniref:Uncharacterized protein n=1 Tax=Elysia marginata TaxID=1093978 RepID=A0AAV4EIF5_9GAST|nr:hypothetical protein ElyMa_005411500 [Elysia marginata]